MYTDVAISTKNCFNGIDLGKPPLKVQKQNKTVRGS